MQATALLLLLSRASSLPTERRWGHGPPVNILYDATVPSGGKARAKPQLQRRCPPVGLAIRTGGRRRKEGPEGGSQAMRWSTK